MLAQNDDVHAAYDVSAAPSREPSRDRFSSNGRLREPACSKYLGSPLLSPEVREPPIPNLPPLRYARSRHYVEARSRRPCRIRYVRVNSPLRSTPAFREKYREQMKNDLSTRGAVLLFLGWTFRGTRQPVKKYTFPRDYPGLRASRCRARLVVDRRRRERSATPWQLYTWTPR